MSIEIKRMFDQIAFRYDLVNDILSLFIHRIWRRKLSQILSTYVGSGNILDLCTGTGSQIFSIKNVIHHGVSLIGIDFSHEMLKVAKKRKQQKPKEEMLPIMLINGDVTILPFKESSFDAATISFGIRNVPNIELALAEIKRVLKPHGLLLVLEFGRPSNPILSFIYQLYTALFLPLIGGLITGKQSAYSYLRSSSLAFPTGKDFIKLLTKAGYDSAQIKPLFSGVSYIYTAFSSKIL